MNYTQPDPTKLDEQAYLAAWWEIIEPLVKVAERVEKIAARSERWGEYAELLGPYTGDCPCGCGYRVVEHDEGLCSLTWWLAQLDEQVTDQAPTRAEPDFTEQVVRGWFDRRWGVDEDYPV